MLDGYFLGLDGDLLEQLVLLRISITLHSSWWIMLVLVINRSLFFSIKLAVYFDFFLNDCFLLGLLLVSWDLLLSLLSVEVPTLYKSPYFYIFLKNFCAWDLVCGHDLVPICFWIIFQFLPYLIKPSRNLVCSSSVHFP
jgi:hypothetical protein